ncbi:hypothetical protein GCM10010216_10490 [Streptomyces flaveolus]|nr:hypothetical protein GCM10010216_10490 [Streptomyces flaveolus]
MIVLTTFGRPGHLRSAMEFGADAFLVKDAPAAQLAQAVRKVLAGERGIDPTLAATALAEGANPLTDREREILRAASDGPPTRNSPRPCTCPRAGSATTSPQPSRN